MSDYFNMDCDGGVMRYRKREKDIEWWCNLTGVKLRPFQKHAILLAAGDAIRRTRRIYELLEGEEVKRKNEAN